MTESATVLLLKQLSAEEAIPTDETMCAYVCVHVGVCTSVCMLNSMAFCLFLIMNIPVAFFSVQIYAKNPSIYFLVAIESSLLKKI